MLIPFLALQQLILSELPEIKTVKIWNGNVPRINEGEDDPYAFPAIMIEFPDLIKWDQLGNGIQIVDPLEISFHVLDPFYDAQDGTKDNNLVIFLLTDKLRNIIQDWMPTSFTIASGSVYTNYAGTYILPFGVFTREKEIQDKNHGALYHFIQSYLTTWVDIARQRPVGGITAGDLEYELDAVNEWSDTSLYLAQAYVWYGDLIYKCILNTTVAHEPPTNTTYFIYIIKK